MKASDLQLLEEKIKKELQSLKISIEELEESVKPISPENAIGRISRMDAINNKSVNEAALRSAKLRFEGLEFALGNIHQKDFGNCARCNSEIPLGRLMMRPQSRTCVNCAH